MIEPIGNRLQFSCDKLGDVQNRLAFLSWAIEQIDGDRVMPDQVFFGLSKELESLSGEVVDIIGGADDQEFIYGPIGVLRDLENDLMRLIECSLSGAFGKLLSEE